MIHLLDHVLFLMLAVLFPIRAVTFGYRRLDRAAEADVPRVRMWLYRQVILIQWMLSAVVLAVWVNYGRPWGALGLVPKPSWVSACVMVGMLAGLAFVVLRRRAAGNGDEVHARVRGKVKHIERMLPHTAHELRWFSAVAVTAGICEELLYRGYLLWYLQHWLPVLPAAAAAAVIFGIGHFYQGPRGVLLTTVVGAFMAAIYLISGSLYTPMLFHAVMDLHSGRVTYQAFRARAAAPAAPAA